MRIKRILVLLLCLALLPLTAWADEAPYYTLTEIYSGEEAHSPAGYLPEGTYSDFDGKSLKRPADVFVDEEDHLFELLFQESHYSAKGYLYIQLDLQIHWHNPFRQLVLCLQH